MIYLKILSYLFTMSFILSQDTKYLQGKIIDSKTKDPLIGANVIIKGTAQGSATNVDGDFYISDIVQSMVNLQVSYIGYKTKTISDIDLKDGLNSDIVIELDADVISVTEVKVQAERKEGGQAEALAKKQDALELQDNISSDQISKSGDSHVADAVRRVTGVTIMNDKFLVVRGLGDRYSSAQLNSVGMPAQNLIEDRFRWICLVHLSFLELMLLRATAQIFQVLSEEEMLISEQNYILLKQFIK